MKLIQRWPLDAFNLVARIFQNIASVVFVAHALALIKNKKFDGQLNLGAHCFRLACTTIP
ncbi:hypothetical protein O9993_19515 [Vibrio lentus]|nr:hypothetical protein [Vibrio lentus]